MMNCEFCKNWDKQNEFEGKCRAVGFTNELGGVPKGKMGILDNCCGGWGDTIEIVTDKAFGCKMWEGHDD